MDSRRDSEKGRLTMSDAEIRAILVKRKKRQRVLNRVGDLVGAIGIVAGLYMMYLLGYALM